MNTHSKIGPTRNVANQETRTLSMSRQAGLRRALEAKKAQLLRLHENREEQAGEVELASVDVVDRAEGVIEDRLRAALDEHARALLGEIEHALAKIDAGIFGFSEMSGRPIPFARLLAVPWARFDADEARRIEHPSRS
jgi:DnaK suppressor protein